MDLKNVKPQPIGDSVNEYGFSQVPEGQADIHFFLYDLGRLTSPPPLQEKSDLQNPRWINVKDIEIEPNPAGNQYEQFRTTENSQISLHPFHVAYINLAIGVAQQNERDALTGASKPVIESYLGSAAGERHLATLRTLALGEKRAEAAHEHRTN